MPGLRHELLVQLFRDRPSLAVDLLASAAQLDLRATTVRHASVDLSQVAPTEYRADDVIVVGEDGDVDRAVVVVEVQLRADERKRLVWPVYISAARAIHGCRAILLVLAPDSKVAECRRADRARASRPGARADRDRIKQDPAGH